MLILTRSTGETIVIGDTVKITFLGRIGREIRIGIEAPKEISIHRGEVYKKIQKEKLKEQNNGN